jgi:4-amino-4-deoxychorismate lyase
VDRCGVAGICRGWAIDALEAEEARMTVDDLVGADAVFLCNAVRGILPVARLRDRTWQQPPQVAAVIGLLARSHPAFDRETP